MHKWLWFVFLVLVFVAHVQIAASQNTCSAMILKARQSADPVREIRSVLDVRLSPACVVEILLLRKQSHVLNTILVTGYKNATQNLQQNGSSPGSGIGTNLVSKSLSSKILSFASEYGAITQTSSGQATTISGSVEGIPLALESHSYGLLAECPLNLIGNRCIRSSLLNLLNRISYSVTLNTQSAQLPNNVSDSSGSVIEAGTSQSGNSTSVSQIAGKIIILQPAVKFPTLTNALLALNSNSPVQQDADKLAAAASTLRAFQENAGEENGEYWDQWATSTAQFLSNVPIRKVVDEWRNEGDALANMLENVKMQNKTPSDDELTQAALNYAAEFAAYAGAERSFFESNELSKPTLSFEYDENRLNGQPSNSLFNFIYSQSLSKWTLTGNAAIAIYNSGTSLSAGTQRLRDIQLAFGVDRSLSKLSILGVPVVSASYYFQDQTSPAILNSSGSASTFTGLPSSTNQLFAQKGKIYIGQFKIIFGNRESGMHIPIAITESNRTELISKPRFGAQLGITYDLDSLFVK